jgi:hypothetical protein
MFALKARFIKANNEAFASIKRYENTIKQGKEGKELFYANLAVTSAVSQVKTWIGSNTDIDRSKVMSIITELEDMALKENVSDLITTYEKAVPKYKAQMKSTIELTDECAELELKVEYMTGAINDTTRQIAAITEHIATLAAAEQKALADYNAANTEFEAAIADPTDAANIRAKALLHAAAEQALKKVRMELAAAENDEAGLQRTLFNLETQFHPLAPVLLGKKAKLASLQAMTIRKPELDDKVTLFFSKALELFDAMHATISKENDEVRSSV